MILYNSPDAQGLRSHSFLYKRKGSEEIKESILPVSKTKFVNIFRNAWSDTLLAK